MIVPSARWFWLAASLALLSVLGSWWPAWLMALIVAGSVWVLALLIDGVRGREIARGVRVQRLLPAVASAGRSLRTTYTWESPTSARVEVQENPPEILTLGTGESRRLTIAGGTLLREELELKPTSRGVVKEGTVHIRVRTPWGLAWVQRRISLPWDLTVYPPIRALALRALPASVRRRREAGLRAVRRIGQGRSFESLREWVVGDDTRIIDWKATARRGKPIARQFEDERREHVLLVIDAGRLMTAEIDGRPRLDAAIDAALQLAHRAAEHDDNVGLMVFADEVMHFIPPDRGRRAVRRMLDALANTSGRMVESHYPAAFAHLAAHNRKRALTVLFTDVIDRTASDALLSQVATLRPRHVPLAVTLRDPSLDRVATERSSSTSDAFRRAAAEELLEARHEALIRMWSQGVLVLDVLPDRAAKAVMEQYALLKRRGMA